MPMQQRLKVHEIYRSIQGESTFAGRPCVFVRTTGCPLRCSWCDTAHAFYEGSDRSVGDVYAEVLAFDEPLVEITGGEPLIQKSVLSLISALCDAAKTVLLETSGAFDIGVVDPRAHVIMDIKCPDSGESARNLESNRERLAPHHELKFVLASRRDYEFARQLVVQEELAARCEVLFSTVFERLAPQQVVAWLLEDRLPVRFQLQLHKYIWDPAAKGV